MLFCEPVFLFIFLPAVLAAYYVSPRRAQNAVLCVASVVFYVAGESRFLGWLGGSIALNYLIARGIEHWRAQPQLARLLLATGITSDLLLLALFKYAGFFVANANTLLQATHWHPLHVPRFALPLGISFFTFHKISYKVDVYRGVVRAKRDIMDLVLYIVLFPQLIAGPIVRYHEIAQELVERHTTVAMFARGARRFIVGLAKKMILANTMAAIADEIFGVSGRIAGVPAGALTPTVAWLGVGSYTLQIYFDFSGYSDMALGLALMLGFHFPENFNYPYISRSITEFWRRWHMSLSRWFRDYLYIPMGGNRGALWRTYFNLTTVFLLCGLWHGASWNFVVWGLFHGAMLVLERANIIRLTSWPRLCQHAYSMVLICIGWVFFRAADMQQAANFLLAMFGIQHAPHATQSATWWLSPDVIAVGIAAIIACTPAPGRWLATLDDAASDCSPLLRSTRIGAGVADCALHGGLLIYSMMLLAVGTYNPFIYYYF